MSEELGKYSCPAAFGLFLITAATIVGAWGFELIGGFAPCPLCLQQRWAYYLVVPLSLILFIFSRTGGASGVVRFGLVVCGLVMLANAGLGGHHAGVEWEWWEGPASCSGNAVFSTDSPLPDLGNLEVIDCSKPQIRIFGLSFAGWNFVISLFAAFIAFRGARKPFSA